MERQLKRISLMIGEDQYEQITARGMNLSWLVRDLVDRYLSDNKISLTVTDETRKLYEQIVGSNASLEADLEPFLKEALRKVLQLKIENMKKLAQSAFDESEDV